MFKIWLGEILAVPPITTLASGMFCQLVAFPVWTKVFPKKWADPGEPPPPGNQVSSSISARVFFLECSFGPLGGGCIYWELTRNVSKEPFCNPIFTPFLLFLGKVLLGLRSVHFSVSAKFCVSSFLCAFFVFFLSSGK